MTKVARMALSLSALVTGFVAAFRWWQASRVEVHAIREHGLPASEPGFSGADAAIVRAFARSADLNKRAARWTALAVTLDGLSSIVDVLD